MRADEKDRSDVADLAAQIYGIATTMPKHDRHAISDMAKLIEWWCVEPWDEEARTAIRKLASSVFRQAQERAT